MPEFSLTRTGRPKTDLRKSEGDRLFLEAVSVAVSVAYVRLLLVVVFWRTERLCV